MPKPSVSPMKFIQDMWAARVSLTLIAAVELDVFTTIAQGKRTAAEVARAIKVPLRGLERMLDALTGLGYLTKRGSRFGLSPTAQTFLVRGKPAFLGAMADESRMTLPGWIQLTDVVRFGRPVANVDSDQGLMCSPWRNIGGG